VEACFLTTAKELVVETLKVIRRAERLPDSEIVRRSGSQECLGWVGEANSRLFICLSDAFDTATYVIPALSSLRSVVQVLRLGTADSSPTLRIAVQYQLCQ
jgi:hypothetical protein